MNVSNPEIIVLILIGNIYVFFQIQQQAIFWVLFAVEFSQGVPYIYEDRLDKAQFFSALSKIYNIGAVERRKMGMAGRKHVETNYNFQTFANTRRGSFEFYLLEPR